MGLQDQAILSPNGHRSLHPHLMLTHHLEVHGLPVCAETIAGHTGIFASILEVHGIEVEGPDFFITVILEVAVYRDFKL